MTTREQDTDPSTPGALRGLAPTDPTPTPVPAAAHVSTDPGLGPASQPPMPSAVPGHRTPPMGIVVPASSAVKPRVKDSVELLLDGMQGPQPERPKTMPATDGQSSASYHVEHMVHAARTSPDDEPKVVVERLPQAATTRIDRSKVAAVIEAAEAYRRANESTAALPQQIAPRVIVAIVAGVVVALAIGVVFALTRGGGAKPAAVTGSAPTVTVTVARTAQPPVVAAAPVVSSEAPQPTASTEPAPAPTETAIAAPAPSHAPALPAWATAPGGKPKTPRPAPTSTAGSGDIGEFKTNLH
jgi:hypothetical protein